MLERARKINRGLSSLYLSLSLSKGMKDLESEGGEGEALSLRLNKRILSCIMWIFYCALHQDPPLSIP